MLSAALVSVLLSVCYAHFIAYPRILESRNDDGDLLLYINDGLTLNLKKISIIAEDFVVTSRGTDSDTAILNGKELEEGLYRDAERHSSLSITRVGRNVLAKGILTHDLRIAPLALSESHEKGFAPHEVFQVTERQDGGNETSDTVNTSLNSSSTLTYGRRTMRPKHYPGTFTVEVCFVTTENYTSEFNSTDDLIKYLAITLNALPWRKERTSFLDLIWLTLLNDLQVELRFQTMRKPKIKFQFNGLFMPEDSYTLTKDDYGVDMEATLIKLKCYVQQCELPNCDIVVLLTSFETEIVNPASGKVDGIAYLAGVCTENKVAVAHDQPHTYDGVRTVAHEIGHLLGAAHDGYDDVPDIGCYPSAENCRWKDAYLMGYWEGGRNKYRVSNCSRAQIQFLFRTLPQSCIQVNGTSIYSTNVLPGTNMTADQFCKIMHPKETNVTAADTRRNHFKHCRMQCCWYDTIDELNFCQPRSMPEGLTCDREKTCRRGICGIHPQNTTRTRSAPSNIKDTR